MDEPLTIKQMSRGLITLGRNVFEMDTAYQTFLKTKYVLKRMREGKEPATKEQIEAQTRVVQYDWMKFTEAKEFVQKYLEVAVNNLKSEKYSYDGMNFNG